MRAAGAVALALALAAGLGCAGHDSPRRPWDPDSEVLPLRSGPPAPTEPEKEPGTRSVVILLPDEDGSVGVIQVTDPSGSATLSRAREAVAFEDLGTTYIADEEEIRLSGVTLAAEPDPPRQYAVYFRSGTTRMSVDSAADWPGIVEQITGRQVPEVTIAGHADRVAGERFNLGLSQRRAEMIRDALVEAGVAAELIEVSWHGETRPAVSTEDGVAEPRNRRAEIRVR